jgi:ion channel
MTTQPDPRRALAEYRLVAGGRTGLLLLILVFTYLLSAFTKGILINAFQIVLFLAVLLIALRNGQLRPHTIRIVSIVVLAGSVLAAVLLAVDTDGPGAGVANVWTALILLVSAVLIVRRVLARPEITLQSIYGAISAYLILGLMFAAFYAAMYRFGGNTFFANGRTGDTRTFQYFSFVTLTTTGYGDYTAAASGGQAVAVIEAITGQIFLATLVARLVAGFRGAARAARGPAAAPRASTPAGARRASTRRAGSSGLIGLRPPGTARRRPGGGKREASPGRGQ